MSMYLKKKKLVHLSLVKPLLSYNFIDDMIELIKNYWNKGNFFPGCFYIYPKLNQSLKWRYDYILTVKSKPSTKKWMIYWTDSMRTWNFSKKENSKDT